ASGSNVIFLILYVGDIIIMGNHIPCLQSVKDYLGKCFAMKDLSEAASILGIKIYRNTLKQLIRLGQNAYMDKILKRYKMDNSRRGHIPMQEKLDLNKTQGASTHKEVKRMKNIPYASAVGSIIYVLVYGGNPKAELRVDCYCDVVFETDRDDTKSQTGYVFILNRGVVDRKSSKQSTTTMSAIEVEYIDASDAAVEAVWIRSETCVSASVKEIDYVQFRIINHVEMKLQLSAFFRLCIAAYTEVKILPNLLRT
nr:hypothetical protein [Tanacetum cinerariifolium]